jgi:hypothetical protein
VFTARYALSPYIKQIRFVFKGLTGTTECLTLYTRCRINWCLTVFLLIVKRPCQYRGTHIQRGVTGVTNKMERIWKETFVAQSLSYPDICREGIRKPTNTFSHVASFLNPKFLKYHTIHCRPLAYDTVQSDTCIPTFQSNRLPNTSVLTRRCSSTRLQKTYPWRRRQ